MVIGVSEDDMDTEERDGLKEKRLNLLTAEEEEGKRVSETKLLSEVKTAIYILLIIYPTFSILFIYLI